MTQVSNDTASGADATSNTDPASANLAAQTYWRSSVSVVDSSRVLIRGYDLETLIGGLSFTSASFLLIRGRLPRPAETRVLDAVLSAVLDYSLEKSGTVAARYVASANPSMTAALAAAVLAVGTFTLAPEDTARFALAAHQRLEASDADPAELAETIVQECRASKTRIPGLGHPVFKTVDPRAQKLKRIAEENGFWGPIAQFYELIHGAFTRLPGKATIPLNDVGMMALILTELGFTPEEMTGLATISTLPGVVAHVSEELQAGRPIRIVPPSTVTYDVTTRDFDDDWRAAGWADA